MASCTILFADVARSTQMYETLGDQLAQQRIGRCIARFMEIVIAHRGEVVKTIGDEVMCTFAEVNDALQCAVEMNRSIEQLPGEKLSDSFSLNIAVGVHRGPVIRKNHDVFGDTVNLAARIVKLAKPRQILLTEQVAGALPSTTKGQVRFVNRETIRGKRGEVKVFEYLWDPKDATILLKRAAASQGSKACLLLVCGKNQITVDSQRPAVSLGRQEQNELILNYERISRSHALIEYRRGKFLLIDHSTNGTYIHHPGEEVLFINQDEVLLTGTGIISLGRVATPGSPGAVHFTVKQ